MFRSNDILFTDERKPDMQYAKTIFSLSIVLMFFFGIAPLHSQSDARWGVESCLTFSHFEQQVKGAIGDPKGEKLMNVTEFGIWLQAQRRLSEYFSVGVYAEYDAGNRSMAEFNGFDSLGRTTVANSLGGTYSEVWIGPFVRFSLKKAFLDVGYGAVGIRNDRARDDVKSLSGETEGSFSVNPLVAWYVGIGVAADIAESFSLLVKLQYRARYYDAKNGEPLMDNIEHGTQNISPFVGLSYSF